MSRPPAGPGRRRTRRGFLLTAAAASGAGALAGPAAKARGEESGRVVTKGRVQQSVCRWCYPKVPLDELCSAASRMGLVGIDLLRPEDFPTLKRHGLVCTMTSSHPLTDGLCDPKYHESSL